MKIKITIQCDNAAFDPASAAVRILRDLADKMEARGAENIQCMDENGNPVGGLVVTDG